MKKLFTSATLVVVIFTVCLYAQIPRPSWIQKSPAGYDGDWDDTYWSDEFDYDTAVRKTQLGSLARYSDIIGVGVVSDKGDGRFTVTVDHTVTGCTNGMSLVVHDGQEFGYGWDHFPERTRDYYMPTNDSRIVFAVYTNDFGGRNNLFWEPPEDFSHPKTINTNYNLRYLNRTWWYPDRDDGELFTHFTNVIQAVRFDPNWTNFFYLCRDGANSPSSRVREDSFWDMRYLAYFSTNEEAQFILDDPLVDPKHKMCILKEGWRQLTRPPIDPSQRIFIEAKPNRK